MRPALDNMGSSEMFSVVAYVRVHFLSTAILQPLTRGFNSAPSQRVPRSVVAKCVTHCLVLNVVHPCKSHLRRTCTTNVCTDILTKHSDSRVIATRGLPGGGGITRPNEMYT